MTQEDIVSSTKTVVQGLETLRVEHHQVLNGLQANADSEKTDLTTTGLIEEKISLLKKSIEMIELAKGEAQVIWWSASGSTASLTLFEALSTCTCWVGMFLMHFGTY